MKHENDDDTSCNCCTWNYLEMKVQKLEEGKKRTSEDHPDYSIIKTGQNTEKSLVNWKDLLSLKVYRSQMTHLLTWRPS